MLGRDSSSCGHAGGGGGDPREQLPFFTSPSKSVFSSRSGQGAAAKCSTPHTKGRSALLGATAPPPRSGSVPGPHKVDMGTHTPLLPLPKTRNQGLVQPKTYHRHQVVLKTSEARSHGHYNIHRKAILTLSLQCLETAPARPCAGPLPGG